MAKYKVLIVDDENFIRERLKGAIPWAEYGMQVVGLAEDGVRALELLEELKPDIIITDIRMPGMTGLEMIMAMQRQKQDVKIIILSGFGEFEYAREAIRLGVTEYLLKPTQPDELLQTLMRIIDELEHSRKSQVQIQHLHNHLDTVRSQAILELLAGNHPGYGWEEEAANVGLSWIAAGRIRLFYISMPHLLLHQDRKTLEVMQFAIQNVLIETIEGYDSMCLVRISRGKWVLTLGNQLMDKELQEFTRSLFDIVILNTKVSLHITVSELGDHYLECSKLYWEVEKTAEYEGQDTNCPIRFITRADKDMAYDRWLKPMQELMDWIAQGEMQQIYQWQGQMEKAFLNWDLTSARRWCFEWLISLRDHMLPQQAAKEESVEIRHQLRAQIMGQYQNKELLQYFNQQLHQIIRLRNGDITHHSIKKAKEIIQHKYDQDIKLSSVAEELGISTVYLSELFRKETNITFREYVMRIRMTEAAEKLKDPTVKVYEVSYLVGYNKVEHFVKLFKKYYGMTPSEYRGAVV
jgi:two-component system response regulator YesN